MNNGIIICTHGKTGIETLNSVEMILGSQSNIKAVEFLESYSPEDIMDKFNSKISEFTDVNNILFLVDIKGGTPFNVAVRYTLENKNAKILTGVNIPMLIEAAMSKDANSIEDLAKLAKEAAIMSIEEVVL